MKRRSFVGGALVTTALPCFRRTSAAEEPRDAEGTGTHGFRVTKPNSNEGILAYIHRTHGEFDMPLFCQILGAANEFKEGDQAIGVAAADDSSRTHARKLLANTKVRDIDANSPHQDSLFGFIQSPVSTGTRKKNSDRTIGELRDLVLSGSESDIKKVASGLSSDVIACVVKLMTNKELIAVGSKIFHALPGSNIGARGYLGARVQPNSPTDNVDDIRWQVFDAWSYAVGDVLLGTNPVSSTPASVASVEQTLQEILTTFGLTETLPHCVLSHIDVQADVEQTNPGLTRLWFQSIAGCDSANKTFDINVDSMKRYAASRNGRFGLYFETGQGADFTNGHGHGFDMVIHESRKYGFARALTAEVAAAQQRSGQPPAPWVHVNDVAGFIGPEVFRSREQLVRCCLEDIVMGKLHGLCIGLDICSTLHMDVSLSDLDWCIDQIMPANPAYLMALPTKIDPMLGYLTTGYQDHVRIREKFGYKVNDAMWSFFQLLKVIDDQGRPAENFGDPTAVYVLYRRRKQDTRSEQEIRDEAAKQLTAVRSRGVFIAEKYGRTPGELAPQLAVDIGRIYDDAKKSIWAELPPEFVESVPNVVPLKTRSIDRTDYILHPESGEQLDDRSAGVVAAMKSSLANEFNAQIVISDGLNALSILEPGHLGPFLDRLRSELTDNGFRVAPSNFIVQSGRVRAGYRIGEVYFDSQADKCAILHVIGERPGTGHRTFSVYITAADGSVWSKPGSVDHDITKVVSGIALTALKPTTGAEAAVQLLKTLV